jgi:uncharacterized protein YgiM (DUF1202 family)
MKRTIHLSIFILVVSLLVSCKSKKSTVGGADSLGEANPDLAVCIWDKVSLKESPADKGKWLASLSLGEKCTYLDDTKEEDSKKYYKVKLQDNKEGWVQSDFVILKSKPATVAKEAEVYSRPDLLTKTDKTYGLMDIVAVKSEQGDFAEVAGKRKTGKWIETGWIKTSCLSFTDVDIAVAKYGSKALSIADRQKRNKALNEIIDNSDYKSSVFINTLFKMVDDSIKTESPEPSATTETN